MTDDAGETKARRRQLRGWGFAERFGDAALTMLISVLGLRLAFAFALRSDELGGSELDAHMILNLVGGALVALVAMVLLGAWAVLVAPLLAAVMLRPLRAAETQLQVIGLAAAGVLTATLPLVFVYFVHYAVGRLPDSVTSATWGLTALAAVTPVLVFFAGKVLARTWLARVVVLLLALASVIHLAFWLTGS